MGSCSSRCVPYFQARTITISAGDYSGCGIPTPPILPITIDRVRDTPELLIFEITIGVLNKNGFMVTLEVMPRDSTFQVINTPHGVFSTGKPGLLLPDYVSFKLGANSPLLPESYVVGDEYRIEPAVSCGIGIGARIQFIRPESGKVETGTFAGAATTISTITNATTNTVNSLSTESNLLTSIVCCKPSNICNTIQVPQINITAQTTIDGSDVGDAIFTVFDDCNVNLEDICAIRYIKLDEVKETIFRQCCPYMVSVIRGKGKTFYDRILSIYNKLGLRVTFVTFYRYLVLYGMAKYILSKLLYGDFNINYLLGKYNEKFLHDLGASRFCGFLEFFEDCESPVKGYNKYFKY